MASEWKTSENEVHGEFGVLEPKVADLRERRETHLRQDCWVLKCEEIWDLGNRE